MLAMDLAPEHAQMGQDLQKAKQDLPLDELEEASFLKSCALILYFLPHTRYMLGSGAGMCVYMVLLNDHALMI